MGLHRGAAGLLLDRRFPHACSETDGPLWVSRGAAQQPARHHRHRHVFRRRQHLRAHRRPVGSRGRHARRARQLCHDAYHRQPLHHALRGLPRAVRGGDNGNPPNRQILHSGNPNGLVANTGQTVPPPGYAQGYARSNGRPARAGCRAGRASRINWDEVQQIAQPTNVSCWATAASMVLGWRDRMSLTVEGIAERAGLTTATGLDPAAVGQFAIDMGMTAEPPQSYTDRGVPPAADEQRPAVGRRGGAGAARDRRHRPLQRRHRHLCPHHRSVGPRCRRAGIARRLCEHACDRQPLHHALGRLRRRV